jgi:hypothetical protein
VWVTCEGERCPAHDELCWRASQLYRCYKDSEETRQKIVDAWEQTVPAALDDDLANQIRKVEQMCKASSTEPTRSNPTHGERQNYGEEDKKSKLLSQGVPV